MQVQCLVEVIPIIIQYTRIVQHWQFSTSINLFLLCEHSIHSVAELKPDIFLPQISVNDQIIFDLERKHLLAHDVTKVKIRSKEFTKLVEIVSRCVLIDRGCFKIQKFSDIVARKAITNFFENFLIVIVTSVFRY